MDLATIAGKEPQKFRVLTFLSQKNIAILFFGLYLKQEEEDGVGNGQLGGGNLHQNESKRQTVNRISGYKCVSE